jgi:hypothetical protein
MALKNLTKFTDYLTSGSPLQGITIEIVDYEFRIVKGFEASVKIKCLFEDMEHVMAAMTGGPRNDGDYDMPVFLNLRKPGGSKGVPLMVCMGARCIGIDGFNDQTTTPAQPTTAFIDLEFLPPTWHADTKQDLPVLPKSFEQNVCFTEKLEQASEFQTMPIKDVFWSPDDKPVSEDKSATIGRLVPQITYLVTRHYVTPEELIGVYSNSTLESFIGTVNKVRYKSIKYGTIFEPQTLLFEAPFKEEIHTGKGTMFNVHFTLRWRFNDDDYNTDKRPQGWNTFARAGKEGRYGLRRPTAADPNIKEDYFPYKLRDWGNWLIKPVR